MKDIINKNIREKYIIKMNTLNSAAATEGQAEAQAAQPKRGFMSGLKSGLGSVGKGITKGVDKVGSGVSKGVGAVGSGIVKVGDKTITGIKNIGGRSDSTIGQGAALDQVNSSITVTPDLSSGAMASATADVASANAALNTA